MGGSGCWVAYTPLAYTETKMKDNLMIGISIRESKDEDSVDDVGLLDSFCFWFLDRSGKGDPSSLCLKMMFAFPIGLGCLVSIMFLFLGSFLPYRKDKSVCGGVCYEG